MKKFIKITSLLEPTLKQSEELFNQGNEIDLYNNGEDWEIEDIFFVLKSYSANLIKLDKVYTPENMKSFIELIWDILWTVSNENTNKTITIQLEQRNESKQKLIIKIINEIYNQEYNISLIKVV